MSNFCCTFAASNYLQTMPSKLELTTQYIRTMYSEGRDFRYDLLSRKIQIRDENYTRGQTPCVVWRNITDKDINTIACNCAQATGASITDREVRIALGSDLVQDVHPLREWIHSLPAYEPASGDWIELVAQQVKVAKRQDGEKARGQEGEKAIWQEYFKKWFVAMVASWMTDEVVNHQVLVLIGRQGTGKTTWLEHLLPPALRDYVTKQASVRELSKDDRIRVAEFGLINMDEIDSCSPRELNVLKSLITTADVNERAAYGHTKERRLRVASFCASGNNKEFLSDDTGNRRWLPFEVESIQNPFYTTLPYELMYAQAWYLIQHGYNYWFNMEDISTLEQHNEEYRAKRNEEELLKVYFEPCEPTESKAVFMTASEIHAKLKMFGCIDKPMPLNKFGELLRGAGYKQRALHGGKHGYIVKMTENLSVKQSEEIHELLTGAGGASIF